MLKRLRWLVAKLNFKPVLLWASATSLFYLLYIWRLGSLTPGLSPAESAAAGGSASLDQIINNPLYGPHKLVQFGLRSALHSSLFSLRLVSVIFIGIFIVASYFLVVKWFGKLIGLTATILLSSLPWLIIIGRSSSPMVLLLAPIAVFASYYWLARTERRANLAWLTLSLTVALSLYVPAMLWLLIISALVGRKLIWFNLKRINGLFLAFSAVVFLILLAPLIYGLWRNPNLLSQIALIPNSWPSILDFVKDAGWSLATLFVRARQYSEYLVGLIPILSALISILFLFGAYAMNSSARKKLILMVSLVVFAVVITGLNNNLIYLTFGLPAIVVIATAGLRFLFLEWQNIFPRNPIPRNFAYLVILSLAAVHIIYGANYALSAWPNTPQTRAVYMIK